MNFKTLYFNETKNKDVYYVGDMIYYKQPNGDIVEYKVKEVDAENNKLGVIDPNKTRGIKYIDIDDSVSKQFNTYQEMGLEPVEPSRAKRKENSNKGMTRKEWLAKKKREEEEEELAKKMQTSLF